MINSEGSQCAHLPHHWHRAHAAVKGHPERVSGNTFRVPCSEHQSHVSFDSFFRNFQKSKRPARTTVLDGDSEDHVSKLREFGVNLESSVPSLNCISIAVAVVVVVVLVSC